MALAVGLCVTALAVSSSAGQAAHDRVQEGAANRSITVDRLMDRPDTKLLGDAALSELSHLPHVSSVEPRAQVAFGYKDATVPGVLLYATTVRPSLLPPVVHSIRPVLFPLHTGEVVLPAHSQGSDLSPLLGKRITVSVNRRTGTNGGTGQTDSVTVVGLFDSSWQIDGPSAAYADSATVIHWAAGLEGVAVNQYTSVVGYDQVTLVADSAAHVPTLLAAVQQRGYAATALQQELTALPGVLDLIRSAGRMLVAVLGVIALVGAFVVSGAVTRQRVREIGILKAVGFRNRSVLVMLLTEMAGVALLGAAVGAVLGIGGAAGSTAALRGDPELAPYLPNSVPLPGLGLLCGLLLLTAAVTVVGAWLPSRRAARLAPSEAISEW
ncbi:ABC transporter permease [Streptacidiphilus rugosus]|uniref:ABC transporter permease n=1 Tax=Streptacidiphilus rugosus TaxID=405783 RepID=UPI001E5FFA5C|nr:ABC transporter permease [Streptacidiphilus rugosus]